MVLPDSIHLYIRGERELTMARWAMPPRNSRSRAMAAILTTADEIEIWLTAPWEEAEALQRPLPDGALKIVAVGQKKDQTA